MSSNAPIALFVYNRPLHTQETLTALRNCELSQDSVLYVYCDGPKMGADEKDLAAIAEVRALVRSQNWCKEVFVIEQKHNRGLANSIIAGVTEVVNRHGKIIVLEDDIKPEVGFLRYMNDALDMYANEEKVMQVSAYLYPVKPLPEKSTFFLRVLSCWGWGTWSRSWKFYNHNVEDHLSYLKDQALRNEFDLYGEADFYTQLLLNKEKIIYSWAVRWYASWFRQNGLCLYPNKSLVSNIGFDGSGVHYTNRNDIFVSPTTECVSVERITLISEESDVRQRVIDFYKNRPDKVQSTKNVKKPSLKVRVKSWIKNRIPYYNTLQHYRVRLHKVFDFPFNLYTPSSVDSDISELARVYPPYKINKTVVGDYSYVSINSIINNTTVGKFCSIGPNLVCGWGIHPLTGVSTSPYFYSTHKQNGDTISNYNKAVEQKSIVIGNDVFIGVNVTVLDGVTIGDGAVIGAGAVVANDIPPYAIAVGVPAKVVKYRFDEETIKKMLEIKWWNFQPDELQLVERDFFDVQKFIIDQANKEA